MKVITRRCCRTSFPLRYKLAAERGVRARKEYELSLENTVKLAVNHGKSELSRVDYLDGWRGIAILLVLMEHFFGVREINVGRMGVDVFFVLSGMLMSNILFNPWCI